MKAATLRTLAMLQANEARHGAIFHGGDKAKQAQLLRAVKTNDHKAIEAMLRDED